MKTGMTTWSVMMALFLAIVVSGGSVAVAQVDNLVLNPSFEEDEAILDDPAWYAWATWNPVEGAGSNATIVDTEAADGTRSLRIDPVGPENWHFIVLSLPIPTEVGASHTASFWAKAAEPRPLGVQFKATDNSDSWGYAGFDLATEWAEYSLTADALNAETKLEFFCAGVEVPFWLDFVLVYEGQYVPGIEPRLPVTIPVEAGGDIAAANELAQAGDTIEVAEGTYVLTSQIAIKDGVTYRGAGAGLTIIDGNNLTRAFVAWGDRSATNGQVDADGVSVPNLTGPKDWVLDGLTIQNCVSDAVGRQDILSAARDLLNNYTGAPYTLETAQAENGGVTNNPEWFDILSGGADDDLTDAELQAYLDANPPGSDGHLIVNDAMDTGGGALVLRNGAAGAVQNCSFLNNQAPLNSGDGGAINAGLGSGATLIIDNCEFNGNSCIDGGGAMRLNSGSACTITGTIFAENQAITESGDGGAIMTSGSGVALIIDNCEFNGNACIDAGGAARLGAAGSTNTITGTTFTGNYIVDGSGDGGAIRVTGDDSTYVLTDCTFIGNFAADDGGAVRYGPDRAELTVTNCSFIANGMDADGNPVGDDGGAWSTNDDDAGPMAFENCLFADNASADDRIIEVKAAFAFLNCTFIGNVAGDEAILAIRGRDWDSTGDGEKDVTTDDSIIANCLFINNTMLSNKEIIGDTRNDVFAPTVINCLFFGNLDQNSEPAINTDGNSTEVGTIDVSAVTDAAQLVVDPLGDYHLAAGSAAIDASDPATATEADIEGTPAVGVRDVGAYEFVGP